MPHRTPNALVLLLGALVLVLGACGSDGAGDEGGTGAAAAQGWQQVEVTDVDGETFTIDSLQPSPVFVENFATWCSNCLRQLQDTQVAAAAAGDEAVFVALSVETDLDAEAVADYADKHGFDDIRFAVMSPEMLAAMDDSFGKPALTPPSTPKVLVDATGTAGGLETGFESPDEIARKLDSAA